MPSNTRLYWLHCLSPTHVGTGRGVGYIDLPVYREKITNWPAFPASGFKGVWADYYQHQAKVTLQDRKNHDNLRAAFGVADPQRDGGDSSQAGALIPTDARLVCLPVRSFRGTFAWCTSRLALHLLRRDLTLARFENLPPLPDDVPEDHVHLPDNPSLKEGAGVYLEDLDFKAIEKAANVQAWGQWIAERVFPGDQGWQSELLKRFAVLPDVVFDYLTETATEVVTRVRIADETKTVAEGQLWTEEALPAESLLAGLVSCDRVFNGKGGITAESLLAEYAPQELTLQIGGKASVGRGRVRCLFTS
jgi:CRISPR-associated protein Cmr4